MKEKTILFFSILLLFVALVSEIPRSRSQDSGLLFKFPNSKNGTFDYTLTVLVPQSLNEYYHGLSHKSYSDADFQKFVTPFPVKPIADALRQVYPEDEDFANIVLMLVHQIPYEATLEEFYPVETLIGNKGDCDMVSVLAASIVEAGGLDVVLLHYANAEHMNIGIHLESSPQDVRQDVSSITDNNIKYYVAECTSSSWQEGWRVGECPEDLKNVTTSIIPTSENELMGPGQVSASFRKIETTTLTVTVSPWLLTEGGQMILEGEIFPTLEGQTVTLFVSVNNSPWTVLNTTLTQPNGQFMYGWKPEVTGQISIRASWAGNNEFAGTVSAPKTTAILPYYILILAIVAAVSIIICLALFLTKSLMRKRKESESLLGSRTLE